MWRRVDLEWTDVSEGRIASILGVEKSENEEPAWAGDYHEDGGDPYLRNVGSRKIARRHITEDGILYSHRNENLKSYNDYERHNEDARSFGTCTLR
jgi:hypothetical protein